MLVPPGRKLALGGAGLLLMLTTAGNTGVALLLGALLDEIQHGLGENWSKSQLYLAASRTLGAISLIYILREGLNVLRRYLVESSCAQINRDMQTKVVGHVLMVDMAAISQQRVGALHGRILRSVDGFVRFLRLMFLDCAPAFFTGIFALSAAITKHPLLGAIMLGVVPMAVWLTLRQLASQRDVRLELLRNCEEIDGTVVEQLSGAEYIRVADTVPGEVQRLSQAAENRRRRELRHHFQMSLFGCAKALNEGLFHVLVLATSTYLAVNGRLSFGDILTFSVLFLNVMAPLNEIHRVLDEGHEASLRVADLLTILQTPVDRSFAIAKEDSV